MTDRVDPKRVGRGGQLLLLDRLPFCPVRDCKRRCVRIPFALTTFSAPFVHPRLFAAPSKEVRLVRPQQQKPYRQGDVLVIPTNTTPQRLTPVPRENGQLVLAHGEATGHAHVVVGEAELFTPSDAAELEERFLRVEAEAQLVHDEHGAITLPPGNYVVRRQREYGPQELRTVAD